MVAGDRRLAGGDHLHIYKHRGTGLGARCARRAQGRLHQLLNPSLMVSDLYTNRQLLRLRFYVCCYWMSKLRERYSLT